MCNKTYKKNPLPIDWQGERLAMVYAYVGMPLRQFREFIHPLVRVFCVQFGQRQNELVSESIFNPFLFRRKEADESQRTRAIKHLVNDRTMAVRPSEIAHKILLFTRAQVFYGEAEEPLLGLSDLSFRIRKALVGPFKYYYTTKSYKCQILYVKLVLSQPIDK